MKIDKKVNSWSGSIEVGVTACDPDGLELPLPSSATELRRGSWIMSGISLFFLCVCFFVLYEAIDSEQSD